MTAVQRSGVLVVDKAAGPTSFDVVGMVRTALHHRRVGHAGTLDPGATGVLPILLGEATKLMPYLQEMDKAYTATVRLGVRTDTQDLTGRVLGTAPVPPLGTADVEHAAAAFVGAIRQVPPMYSAVHHEGRRLYELAREGVEVARQAREVLVHEIAVEEVALPVVRLRVVCGKGTYVRTLAADLGEALGCGGAVEALRRTQVGPFGLDHAVPSAVIRLVAPDELSGHVQPPRAALAGWPSMRLPEAAATRFLHGQAVELGMARPSGARWIAVLGEADEVLLGIGEICGERVQPARILHADHPGPRVLPA